jgi:uncharacterized protein
MPADFPTDPEARAAAPSRARLAAPLFAAILGFAVGDALRPPDDQLSAKAAIASIDVYRATLSPALAKSGLARCKYEPTCSVYAREAIQRYGSPRGFTLATARLLRCNPWARGGYDPVP